MPSQLRLLHNDTRGALPYFTKAIRSFTACSHRPRVSGCASAGRAWARMWQGRGGRSNSQQRHASSWCGARGLVVDRISSRTGSILQPHAASACATATAPSPQTWLDRTCTQTSSNKRRRGPPGSSRRRHLCLACQRRLVECLHQPLPWPKLEGPLCKTRRCSGGLCWSTRQ